MTYKVKDNNLITSGTTKFEEEKNSTPYPLKMAVFTKEYFWSKGQKTVGGGGWIPSPPPDLIGLWGSKRKSETKCLPTLYPSPTPCVKSSVQV